ncbi:MAG TPA: DinB family protein [Dehalococcoidia bacterium]|nr:DinB family protein [Dehalococcoidia bacterium]
MNVSQFAASQLGGDFDLVDAVIGGLDDAQYNWTPPGTCNPIARTHAHALTAVDFFVHMVLQGKPMLWPETAARTGLPENAREIWGTTVQIPLAPMVEYGKRVREAALAYVGSLTEDELDREVETFVLGKQPASFVVTRLLNEHLTGHTGEMSAVKGMQGLKGLPF